MKQLRKIVLVCSMSAASSSDEHNREIMREAANNVSSELVECGAYFQISSEALRRTGRSAIADAYESHSEVALDRALTAAQIGRSSHMAEKVTLARYELSVKDMLAEMDNDMSNISILLNKYATRCKMVIERPERIMEEWGNKAMSKESID
jgi:pyruvate formate-lyase activating enzyme-like uncharacterized protein